MSAPGQNPNASRMLARRMPRDWRRADPRLTEIGHCHVHGIVERFGRYVLGTKGWRAEWVVIRELMARDTTTALSAADQSIVTGSHAQVACGNFGTLDGSSLAGR
jgi:hypothetical protein